MNSFSHAVPPGFRFHPTDEELVDYYLRKRVASKRIDLDVIKDLDLYRIEPWDLQELCNNIGAEDQSDYYFFSHKDKKYPTGTRTNRATKQGFWKATGRDKPIYLKHSLVGMRKTLVFYKGRAPNGLKLDWIMHEYRLETDENAAPQEEGWVVCRVFKKRLVNSNMKKDGDQHSESPYWYDEQASSFMPDMDSPMPMVSSHPHDPSSYSCMPQDTSFLDLPQLQTSLFPKSASTKDGSVYGSADQAAQEVYYRQQFGHNMTYGNNSNSFTNEDVHMSSDWRVVDRFVASQLSHGDAGDLNNGPGYC